MGKRNLIDRQKAIDVVAQSYRYESDRITALQKLPAITEEEIRAKAVDEFARYIAEYVDKRGIEELFRRPYTLTEELAEAFKEGYDLKKEQEEERE